MLRIFKNAECRMPNVGIGYILHSSFSILRPEVAYVDAS